MLGAILTIGLPLQLLRRGTIYRARRRCLAMLRESTVRRILIRAV